MPVANYDHVLEQLCGLGLQVERLVVGKLCRCRVEGSRESKGWYRLYELVTDSGDVLLVGSYGVWHGADNNARKVELGGGRQLSTEQRESLRRRMAEDRKRADAARKADAARAARHASYAWSRYATEGGSEYLAAKGIRELGTRFTSAGSVVVPVMDAANRVHGLQFIRTADQARQAKRPRKEFWPAGMAKKGHYHLIGSPQWIVLVAEGYGTAASLHLATTFPTAVAFDAGNLPHVARALKERYRTARVLVCADNDDLAKCIVCHARFLLALHPESCPACGQPHKRGNAGIAAASAAALDVDGHWMVPVFADEAERRRSYLEKGTKQTDFNDLHCAEGLHVVRAQVEAKLLELSWRPPGPPPRGQGSPGGRGDALRPIDSVEELLERYALVYGQGGTVFDSLEHRLVALSDMRDACIARELHRAWMEHPDRQMVRVEEVGFDPSEEDPDIRCNLWGGWPTESCEGNCDYLLDLLLYMCGGEAERQRDLYHWMLCWLAYPIQHPGAKMKTTVVVHGPQGTGKNLFFETYMGIFGRYGRVIDQSAVEDKFNDWASRKLFLIADEVVARSEVWQVKNRLKSFISGDWIRINPKGMAAYDERNHCNIVFLSNESMPVVLEEDDRRHAVVWTPAKLEKDFYGECLREIREGGVAALHHKLLHHDLGDFQPGTLPPDTQAKRSLVTLSLDNMIRFVRELDAGEVGGVKRRPCTTGDMYDLYRAWCSRTGQRPSSQARLLDNFQRRHKAIKLRKRYRLPSGVDKQSMVLTWSEHTPPPGENDSEWFGGQIQAFEYAANDYIAEKRS